MSILSTNRHLINVGKDYSAGYGIDITNDVISVSGNIVPYSAGDNIDIQDHTISSKDWSNDITEASANAYNETTAWVHENYTTSADVSFLSAEIDNKLDSSAWSTVSGSLATEDYVILSDNLTYSRATAFTTAQEYAKESACNSAFDYLNENKLDVSAFDLPNSGHWNEATNVVETNSAAWFDNVGDAEVNSFVYNNSSTILDVDTTYQQNSASYITAHQDVSNKLDTTAFSTVSGDFLTAAPADMATTGDVAELSQTISETYQVKGDYLVRSDSANFYPANNPSSFATEDWVTGQGYITGVEIPESAVWQDVSTTVQTNSADWASHQDLSYISGVVDDKLDTTAFNLPDSANWNEVSTAYQNNSATYLTSVNITESANWEEATQAYEQNSATYLTSHQDLSDYQTIAGMTAYQPVGDYYSASNPSGFITGVDLTPYYTTADANTLSSMLSGAIDYVSANAGGVLPASANEAITAYQNASGTYLTAISIPDSATWNDVSTTVQTNSAAWGQGGVISSYTTTWDKDVPPYGANDINSLNGLYISSFKSKSAEEAGRANLAESAYSAGYTQTVNVTYVENQGFARNLSSEYGTIYVTHNNLLESTNSAVLRTGEEGFVSSFDTITIGEWTTANFSWDKVLPNTVFSFISNWAPGGTIITYSANTNLTGEIEPNPNIPAKYNISIPNATALSIFSNKWVEINNNVASAADTFETVVGELAWASALPIYEYDSSNKISAINGSALAGGGAIPESAHWEEATNAYEQNSGTYLTSHQIIPSSKWENASDVVQSNSGNWQDITAYQTNSASYLTAIDLTPYYTTAEAETLSSMLSGAIDYVSANAGDEFPVSADEAIQYVQTNSGTIDETVTAYQTNSSNYMVEPNLEYNAVNEISGYNGSAIAQYGAEKQWLVHDDTLVHVANSAQYALGVNLSAIAQLIGVDETLLFSASTPTSAAELSENMYNFDRLRVYIDLQATDRPKPVIEIQPHNTMTIGWGQGAGAAYYTIAHLIPNDNTHLIIDLAKSVSLGSFTSTAAAPVTATTGSTYQKIISKIVGIGRKN